MTSIYDAIIIELNSIWPTWREHYDNANVAWMALDGELFGDESEETLQELQKFWNE